VQTGLRSFKLAGAGIKIVILTPAGWGNDRYALTLADARLGKYKGGDKFQPPAIGQ